MTDPVLRDLVTEKVRQGLGLAAGEELPLTFKTIKVMAALLDIPQHSAGRFARRGELPGQLTLEEPFVFATHAVIQALLGDGEPRVDALDAPAGDSRLRPAGEPANGRRQGQLPARILSVPGREPSSEERR